MGKFRSRFRGCFSQVVRSGLSFGLSEVLTLELRPQVCSGLAWTARSYVELTGTTVCFGLVLLR